MAYSGKAVVVNGDDEQIGIVVDSDGDKELIFYVKPGQKEVQSGRFTRREPGDYDERGAGGTYRAK